MKKIDKNVESPHKSYLVEAKTFNDLGEPIHVPGVVTREKCKELAKCNHRICEGRGVLNFDNGRYLFDSEGKRKLLTQWVRSCDCVSRKLIKNESSGDFSHLRG